jgi:hypothetical protein
MRPHGHNEQMIGGKGQSANGIATYLTQGTGTQTPGEFQMKRFLQSAWAVIREGIEDEPLGLDERRKGNDAARAAEERDREGGPSDQSGRRVAKAASRVGMREIWPASFGSACQGS